MEDNVTSFNVDEEHKPVCKDFKKVQVTLEKPLYKEASKKLIDEDKTWQDLLRASVLKYIKE